MEIVMNIRTTLLGIISMGMWGVSYAFAQTSPEPTPTPAPNTALPAKSAASSTSQKVALERLQLPKGQKYIYGWQLMTGAERASINDRLRRATSERERAQIRADHRAQMDERASKLGYSLTAEPSTKVSRKVSSKTPVAEKN
jgi:hypothetical protein